MDSKTFSLQYPIQLGSESKPIDSVTVARPKGKHLRKLPMGAQNLSSMLDFAAALTNLTGPEIDAMDAVDALALFEVIQDFLPSGLKTGQKVSG